MNLYINNSSVIIQHLLSALFTNQHALMRYFKTINNDNKMQYKLNHVRIK